jgi:hypothetical protein
MRDKIDLMLVKELWSENPRSIRNDLIDPLAVAQRLVALVLVHDGLALVAPREVVVAAPHQQVRVGEPAIGDYRSK